jgi:hypothetical protein
LGKELAGYAWYDKPSGSASPEWNERKMILDARIVLWLYRSRLLQYVYSRMLSNAVIFFPFDYTYVRMTCWICGVVLI